MKRELKAVEYTEVVCPETQPACCTSAILTTAVMFLFLTPSMHGVA